MNCKTLPASVLMAILFTLGAPALSHAQELKEVKPGEELKSKLFPRFRKAKSRRGKPIEVLQQRIRLSTGKKTGKGPKNKAKFGYLTTIITERKTTEIRESVKPATGKHFRSITHIPHEKVEIRNDKFSARWFGARKVSKVETRYKNGNAMRVYVNPHSPQVVTETRFYDKAKNRTTRTLKDNKNLNTYKGIDNRRHTYTGKHLGKETKHVSGNPRNRVFMKNYNPPLPGGSAYTRKAKALAKAKKSRPNSSSRVNKRARR